MKARLSLTFPSAKHPRVLHAGGLNGVLGRLPALTLALPGFLQPPKDTRSSNFRVLYLDDDLRVTRGDRGELRVFTRV
jgi:PAP_fibrillin